MNIVAWNLDNKEDVLSRVERILRDGGIVAGPTDTVYGLFANASDGQAVTRLFAIKNRPEEKAFPVFVKDIAMARWFAYISDAKARVLESLWPGAITVVFHHKDKLPPVLTGGLDTIAMRIPAHSFLAGVLPLLDFPIVQTSANISGELPARNIQEIRHYFDSRSEQPDLVIDGGEVNGEASVIIDFSGQQPRIIRSGVMSREQMEILMSKLQI